MALDQLIQSRLIEVGKIKVGTLGPERTSQGGGTWRPPVKLDHFLVTTLQRDAAGLLQPDAGLMAALSEHADPDGKLRRLPVQVLSNDVEEVLTARYAAYAGKRAAAVSDGLTLTEYQDGPDGAWFPPGKPRTVPHTPETTARWGKALKLATTLNVVINSPHARWGGVYKFRTTSRITAEQLYGSLLEVQRLTAGVLRGLPLRLVVRPLAVCPEGKPMVVYVVHAELAGADLLQLRAEALQQLQQEVQAVRQVRALEAQYRALLAHEPDDLDPEEVAAAEAEHEAPAPAGPPPPAETPEQAVGRKMRAASSVAELAEVWNATPPTMQKSLVALKDELKAKLTAAAERAAVESAARDRQEQMPDAEYAEAPPPDGKAVYDLIALAAKKGYGGSHGILLSWVNMRFGRDYAGGTALGSLTAEEREYLAAELNQIEDRA